MTFEALAASFEPYKRAQAAINLDGTLVRLAYASYIHARVAAAPAPE